LLDSNVATVALAINPVNDAPLAVNDSFATDEDTVLTITAPGVLANDTDVDSPVLTAVVVTGPGHGTLTLDADGGFTYTPAANFNGSDSLATDVDTALPITAPGVLGNDTDVDSPVLTAVVVTGPSHGALTLNANGSFTYTPAANFNGSDSFTYKANDGQADSNVATVALTINPVNDAPVAVNDSFATNEDTALTITAPGVLANDTDVDGNSLTAVVVTGPSHGALTLNT